MATVANIVSRSPSPPLNFPSEPDDFYPKVTEVAKNVLSDSPKLTRAYEFRIGEEMFSAVSSRDSARLTSLSQRYLSATNHVGLNSKPLIQVTVESMDINLVKALVEANPSLKALIPKCVKNLRLSQPARVFVLKLIQEQYLNRDIQILRLFFEEQNALRISKSTNQELLETIQTIHDAIDLESAINDKHLSLIARHCNECPEAVSYINIPNLFYRAFHMQSIPLIKNLVLSNEQYKNDLPGMILGTLGGVAATPQTFIPFILELIDEECLDPDKFREFLFDKSDNWNSLIGNRHYYHRSYLQHEILLMRTVCKLDAKTIIQSKFSIESFTQVCDTFLYVTELLNVTNEEIVKWRDELIIMKSEKEKRLKLLALETEHPGITEMLKAIDSSDANKIRELSAKYPNLSSYKDERGHSLMYIILATNLNPGDGQVEIAQMTKFEMFDCLLHNNEVYKKQLSEAFLTYLNESRYHPDWRLLILMLIQKKYLERDTRILAPNFSEEHTSIICRSTEKELSDFIEEFKIGVAMYNAIGAKDSKKLKELCDNHPTATSYTSRYGINLVDLAFESKYLPSIKVLIDHDVRNKKLLPGKVAYLLKFSSTDHTSFFSELIKKGYLNIDELKKTLIDPQSKWLGPQDIYNHFINDDIIRVCEFMTSFCKIDAKTILLSKFSYNFRCDEYSGFVKIRDMLGVTQKQVDEWNAEEKWCCCEII